MNAKKRSLVVNLNRGLIFALALTGLLMDGYQGSDLPSSFALVFWLWLPLWSRIEANILKWVQTNDISWIFEMSVKHPHILPDISPRLTREPRCAGSRDI